MIIEDKEERRDLLFQAIEEAIDKIINERLKNSNWEKLNQKESYENNIYK